MLTLASPASLKLLCHFDDGEESGRASRLELLGHTGCLLKPVLPDFRVVSFPVKKR